LVVSGAHCVKVVVKAITMDICIEEITPHATVALSDFAWSLAFSA